MSVTTKLDTRLLDQMLRDIEPQAEALVDKTAFDIQGRAQNNAPVDTSALRNSIYTVTSRSDGYMLASQNAKAANPSAETSPLPEPGDMEAHVGPSVEYAIYQELGTSRMPAHPYLVPAVEAVRKTWEAAWKALLKKYE